MGVGGRGAAAADGAQRKVCGKFLWSTQVLWRHTEVTLLFNHVTQMLHSDVRTKIWCSSAYYRLYYTSNATRNHVHEQALCRPCGLRSRVRPCSVILCTRAVTVDEHPQPQHPAAGRLPLQTLTAAMARKRRVKSAPTSDGTARRPLAGLAVGDARRERAPAPRSRQN